MKIGEYANKLLLETKRNTLKHYDKDIIRKIEEENRLLESKLLEIQDASDNLTQEISVNYLLIMNHYKRNLRIIRTYKYNTINKIINNILNQEENEMALENQCYFNKIKSIFLKRYNEFSFLNFVMNDPPLSFYLQIFVKKDCGIVMDNDNIIELKENKVYYLKKSVIEHLLMTDYIEIIE